MNPTPPPEYARYPELAVVSLLYMLTRRHATGCRALAESIAAHLAYLATDARQPTLLRDAAKHLGLEWQGLLEAADHDGALH